MASFLSQLESISSTLVAQPTSIKVIVTLAILLAGFILGRILSRLFERFYFKEAEELVDKIRSRDERRPGKSIEYLSAMFTITIALIYLNSSATNQLFSDIVNYLPGVLTAILTFILGILIVRIIMDSITGFIETIGFKHYARDLGFSEKLIELFLKGLKVFLYLVVLEVSVIQLGISSQIIENTITAATYGFVAVLGLLGFFGFKDLIQNYAAGIYLRGSDVLKPGKRVKINEESGEIRDISAFGTTVTTDTGYFLLTPNKELMDKDIMFKRVKADVETLEDMKNYFVAQEPSYCGPASAEMALAMFGFDITQGDLAEESGTQQPGGVMPDDLIDAVERLSNGEVRGAYVEYDKITDLSDEFKTWFHDGGLVVANFAKPVLFPNTDTAHYSLSVGVEGDELLIVDPSAHTVSGGVYYVDSSEMLEAMSEFEGRERGYIVLAPKGTTAYWRIKEDLIYADTNLYDQLSKSLELQLGRILRQGRILKQVMPDAAEDFLDRWRRGERVKRLWKPDENQSEGGDKKLDEFTGSDE